MPEMMWKYPQDRPYSQKYLADYLHTARTLVSALEKLQQQIGQPGEYVRRAAVSAASNRLADFAETGVALEDLLFTIEQTLSRPTGLKRREAMRTVDELLAQPGVQDLLTPVFEDAVAGVAEGAKAVLAFDNRLKERNYSMELEDSF